MTDELTAVAERLGYVLDGPEQAIDFENMPAACIRDLWRLARASHRPDDGEPLDEAWLRQLGGAYIDCGIFRFRNKFGIEWFVWLDGTCNFGDPNECMPCETRGDIRLLCRALRIELKE